MGLFSRKKPKLATAQPRPDWPWTLNRSGSTTEKFTWNDIHLALDALSIDQEDFLILEQTRGKDYWFIQSAVTLAGPHQGQYNVGCGWSDGEGPHMLEWYGSEEEAIAKFRTVWERKTLDFSGFEDQSNMLPENQRKERLAIACRAVGELETNCYFVTDQIEKVTAVIDPGADGDYLLSELRKLDTRVQYILLTHGHYDHTGAVLDLHRAYPEAEIYIHPKDYPGPDDRLFPLYRQLGGTDCPAVRFFKPFNDRDLPSDQAEQLPLGGLTIHPMHTPGHSEGSVSLRISCGPIFSGDSLFAGSCGRTDFPGGNVGRMMSTLRFFGQMQDDAQVLPGHMGFTTLEEERKHNPYLQQALREAP